MANKIFSLFQSDLEFSLGRPSGDLGTYVDNWINTAYMTIATKQRHTHSKTRKQYEIYFPQLETIGSVNTVDGTATVAVPADCLYIRTVHDSTSDVKLTSMDTWEDYVAKTGRADTDQEAAPTEWVRHASTVYLYPTPDAVYAMKIWYRKRPAALTAAGDQTVLGEEWDEPIQLLATAQSFMRMREFDNAKIFRTEFDEMMDDLCEVYFKEHDDKQSTRYISTSYLSD